jgi:LPXTG-site transpeptidase (sortase) family protein
MTRRLVLLAAAVLALAGCKPADVPARPPIVPVDVQPVLVAEPAGLDIPAIGVHVRGITRLELDEHGAMEIPADPAVVGWYPLGPAPGENGPAVLTGHVNYGGTAGVFARLHELKAGDHVTVPRTDGTAAEFVVYAVDEYAKDQFPTETVYGDTAEPVLRLITCGGELDRAAHSYRDNIVVSARLAT